MSALFSATRQSRVCLASARQSLGSCDPKIRFDTLLQLWTSGSMRADDWIGLLAEEWRSCATLDAYADKLWNETPFGLLAVEPALQKRVMNEAELAAFDALPDQLTLYRACHAANKWGLCWTIERALAERAPGTALGEAGPLLLVTARARKDQILAVKIERKQVTIVAMHPRHVSTSKLRKPVTDQADLRA